MNTEEIWKPVVGFENHYLVSNMGRVASIKKQLKVLKPGLSSNGYLTVCLHLGKFRKSVLVQWLVAEAFIGVRPDGLHVLHNDGCRTNNCASNLRYGSRSENTLDKILHGRSRLKPNEIKQIRQHLQGGLTPLEVANMFGVTRRQIYYIRSGKQYASV